MADWHKLAETILPKLLRWNKSRTVLFLLFWPATVLMGVLFIVANPVLGWFMIGIPLLLAALTRRRGLANVPLFVLVLAGVALIFPAFFLGRAKGADDIGGLPLVALIMFVVWVATYPLMLKTLNEQYLKEVYPDEKAPRDGVAEVRRTIIGLWLATITMQVVGAEFATLVCLIALWHRRQWSAWITCAVCLMTPLLVLRGGALEFDFELVSAVSAILAAWRWFDAARLPFWDKRHVSYR